MEATGTRLGRYRLVRRVGEGGMGVVHLALDEQGRAVAVKALRPHVAGDPQARQRLAREVQTLQRVVHPRVAPVLDADVDGETPFVVTPYVPAPSLDALVCEHGPLDRRALATLGDGLGEALAAIHAAGVVHRDLKPGNVLLLDGDPVVIDFGIAHVVDEARITRTGLVMGTPGFLSPEVLAGEPVTEATDWWGWAATMAFAATGRPPFGRGPMEVVLDRVRRGQFDLDGVPAGLVGVLARGLAVDPAARPAPGELRMAVAALRAEPQAPHPAPQPQPQPQRSPSRPQAPDPDPGQTTEVLPVQDARPRVDATRPLPLPAPPPPAPPAAPVRGAPARQTPVRQEPPAQPAARPAPHGRAGVLLAALVAFAAVAAVVPVAAVIIGLLGSVLARTVDRSYGSLQRRRYERGPRAGDAVWAALGSPLHLIGAAVVSLAAAILPLLVGLATVFTVGWLVGTGGVPTPAAAVPLAAGAVAAAWTAWWGPGGTSLRRGSRFVARAVAPSERAAKVVVALLVIVAAGAVLVVLGGAQPDWSPLGGPPLGLG